jgi:formate dehydrogenase major subunit
LQLGFKNGDFVDIVTRWDDDDRERCADSFRIVEYETPRGSAAAYYPETNPLIPLDSTALGSNCPTSKSIIVKLVPAGVAASSELEAQSQAPVGADWNHKSEPGPVHLS